MQAAKYGAVAGVLYLDPNVLLGFGGPFGIVSIVLGVAAFYDPIGFRIGVNIVEDKCRAQNVPLLTEQQIEKIGPWDSVKAFSSGSIPVSRLFGLHSIDLEKPTEEKKE